MVGLTSNREMRDNNVLLLLICTPFTNCPVKGVHIILDGSPHETIYSPEVQQWMNFAVQPLAEPGYVSFIFMNISEEHAREMHVQRERVTNEVIVRVTKILNDGEGYESAMNHALQEISRFIHPDRIYLLETDGNCFSGILLA